MSEYSPLAYYQVWEQVWGQVGAHLQETDDE